MRIDAYAKINLYLAITGILPNGYHELDMLMQTIDLKDTLELEKNTETALFVNGKADEYLESNLIVKAVRALERECGQPLNVTCRLIKRIPSRAGLGGGSSDCASALIAVNKLYGLGYSEEKLAAIALKLGADVPFFLKGGLCRVRGIGEIVEKLAPAKNVYLGIKHVGEGLSTKDVYGSYNKLHGMSFEKSDSDAALTMFRACSYDDLTRTAKNDLEKPALEMLPEIEATKRGFINNGALFTMMSGSGSAVYAIFENENRAVDACERIAGAFVTKTVNASNLGTLKDSIS